MLGIPLAALGDDVKADKRRGERLLQPDLTIDLKAKIQFWNCKRYTCRKSLITLDVSLFQGFSHRLFDFALRIDAHNLEEFADAEVEGFFMHRNSFLIPEL